MTTSRKHVGLMALGLFLLTVGLYWPATRFDFVNFDDPHYVTGNDFVSTGLLWENVKRSFSAAHSANWHPLTWISHMMDCELFGLKPCGHHAMNVLFHAANGVLLFLVLWKMTRISADPMPAFWGSALVAGLFALHPLHVESVAWVSERKDVLSTFFGLLAIWFYTGYVQAAASRQKFYAFALLFFMLSLLSKAMLVTLPFLLLLLDFWPLRRVARDGGQEARKKQARGDGVNWRVLLVEKIPFLALSFVFSVLTFVTQKEEGAVRSVSEFSLPFRFANALVSYVRYLGKTFWPTELAVFYPMPEAWAGWQIAGAAILLLGLSVLALGFWKAAPYLAAGWFWFLGTLVPVIGLVQVSEQAMADRYSYVPLIGVFIALVWGGMHLWQTRLHISPKWLGAVGLAVIFSCALLTSRQLQHWRNTETLFRHAIAVTQKNYLALNHLSTDLLEQGRAQEAEAYLTEAVKLRPNFFQARVNLGNILANQGRLAEAEAQFREAAKISPESADAHYNLANALRAQGKKEEAQSAYATVLQLDENYADAHGGLALLLVGEGNLAAAAEHYAHVARLRPEKADAHYNLATAFFHLGRWNEAKERYERALQLRPDLAPAHLQLGRLMNQGGDKAKAALHFTEALRLQPDSEEARHELDLLQKNSP